MGCVSSNLLNHDDEFSQFGGGSGFGHHIVKLTSTTYGLLTLDPPSSPPPSFAFSDDIPMSPPEKFTFDTEIKSEPRLVRSEPEVINSWELMSGLDAESFRFSPLPLTPVKYKVFGGVNKENSDPNRKKNSKKSLNDDVLKPLDLKLGDKFERICPPGGENRVVIYTTSLRGVRRTFEACNAVRSAIESSGIVFCERDVSMDKGFKEELASLMARVKKNGNPNNTAAEIALPPRVFVKGRYIGGAEELLRLIEEGLFGELIRGLPRKKIGGVGYGDGACDGCGGLYFLPCFHCNGSCKMVKGWGSDAVVVRCMDCNENGLVPCPICS